MSDIERLSTELADRYRIERELGQGGMATVYLARDLRHDRLVALKVLRPELAAILGAERFLQEIKTTANLQHPHILPLHDSGEAGGNVFYVMPYVDGESLRDRLARDKQLPVDVAVRITSEVASALDYAHRHGVVHRDIKPENILLHEGQALVADFGIALAVSRSDGGTRMTETGMSLGTPHYMSPEQAMGEREITPRSDVYALGCVAYEMLTGDPPFTGSTAQAIVARVLTEQPRTLTMQRHTIPPHVEAAILTALEKLPADRFATAAEFAEALANPALTAARTRAAAPAQRVESRWRRIALGTAAVAVAAIGVALWAWLRPAAPRPVNRYSLGLPAAQSMQQGALGVNLAISPDGRRLVYVGPGQQGGQLWVRERDRLDATALAGTEGAVSPSFSPNGRQIAFSSGGQFALKVVSIDGGPPVTLSEPGAGAGGGVAWGSDGWIYFDRAEGLGRIRAGGGAVESAVPLDTAGGELGHAWPELLPDGKAVIFRSRRNLNPDDFDLVAYDLTTHRRHVLTKGLMARYVAPGYLMFVRADGSLVASRFSSSKLALIGPTVSLLEGVMTKPFGSVDLAVSREGTLAYVPGAANAAAGLAVWVTRRGEVALLNPTLNINPSGNRRGLALSPDGSQLAVDVVGPRSVDIWVKRLPSGAFSRLTFDGSDNFRPSWTADGKSVVFLSVRTGGLASVWRQRADGSTPAEQVLRRPTAVLEAQLSRDGRWLIYRTSGSNGQDIYGIQPGRDTTPVPLVATRFNEFGATLSPDGAFLAYASDESGQPEVYVRPFPRTGDGRWQISTGGGFAPRWSHSGRELFFENIGGGVMASAVTSRPTFSAASAQPAIGNLGGQLWGSNSVPYWDVSPDDRRFLMVRIGGASQEPGAGQLVVIENWLPELRAKVEGSQR